MKLEDLKQRPAGEPMVWLTAMGLALGTVMVVCLLWVIFVNGITVFWPKPVYQLELDANSTHRVSAETNVFAGAITMDREITGADDGTRGISSLSAIRTFTASCTSSCRRPIWWSRTGPS